MSASLTALCARIILEPQKPVSEDDTETLLDYITDKVDRNLSRKQAKLYEKNPRSAAELILRKISGEKEETITIQNLARRYLQERPKEVSMAPVKKPEWRPIRPSRELIKMTPANQVKIVYLPQPIEVDMSLPPYHFATPDYAELIENTEKSVVVQLKLGESYAYGRPVPGNKYGLSWQMQQQLGGVRVEQVRYLTDLQPVREVFVTTRGETSKEELQQALYDCPVVFVGQLLTPVATVRAVEPPYAFLATPLDEEVPTHMEEESIEHTRLASAACFICYKPMEHERGGECGGCRQYYYCSEQCQAEHWKEHQVDCAKSSC
jgi:hypothetical protein